MRATEKHNSWAVPTLAWALLAGSGWGQQASTSEWNADPGTPGNWADATWTAGVPAADSLAGIANGGTVGVTAPTAVLEQLSVSGGSTLNLGAALAIEGTNLVDVPDPDPDIPATGFYLYGGNVNVNSGGDLKVTAGGSFRVGMDATGALNLLDGGVLTTDREIWLGAGGTAGLGTLTQTGGTLTHTVSLFKVGPNSTIGHFNISGGTAAINSLRLKFGGTTAGQLCTINQSGGDVTYSGETAIGWDTVASATYNLSNGTVTTGNRIRIGVANKGDATRVNTFNQTGGDVSVTGRIDIGDSPPPEVVNLYDISGGTLTTTSQVQVGAFGNATGTFKLRGSASADLAGLFIGTNATNTGTVSVEGDAVCTVTNLEVRNGTLTQSGEFSQVEATSRLWLGTTQTVSQAATLTLTQGTLNLLGTANIVGNGNAGNATLNIQGGTLESGTRLRVGVGKTDGTLTPTNTVNQTGGTVNLTGRLDLGENPGPTNIYQISGGSLTATSNILVGYWSDGTGTFTVSGTAQVDAPTVVMGENAGTVVNGAKGTVNLNGGVLTTSLIKVGNGLTADQKLNLNGGTIKARSDGADLISGNVTTASLLAGGITFDSNGFAVSTSAVMTGPGGLTKKGAGTLTVNGLQAYTGATAVEGGTLVLAQPYLADNADLRISAGATLELTHGATDTIGTLFLDGVAASTGEWGPSGSGAAHESPLLTGTGRLNVTSSGVSVTPRIASVTVNGTTATITIAGAPNTTYACKSSDDLVSAFTPIATVPATVTTDAAGAATFTVDASVARRFYRVGP